MTAARQAPATGLRRVVRLAGRLLGVVLVTAYSLVVRFAVAVAAVWGVLYFLIASQPFKAWVEGAVSDAIPGSITCATVRWGPSPWRISVTGGRIHGARGETVIDAPVVRAELDLGATLLGLVRFIDDTEANPFPLHVDFAEVLEATAHIRVGADGRVGIVDTFESPSEGDGDLEGPPLMFDIHVADAVVHRSGGTVEAPGFLLTADGLSARTDFHLTGPAVLGFAPARVEVARVETRFSGMAVYPGDLVLDAHDVKVRGFRWVGEAFFWDRVEAGLGQTADRAHGHLVGAGLMNLEPDVVAFEANADVVVAPHAPVASLLTADLVEGGFNATVRAEGDVEAVRARFAIGSEALRVGGVDLSRVSLEGRVEPRADPVLHDVHAILVDRGAFELAGGQVGLSDVAWEPTAEPEGAARDFTATFQLDQLDILTLRQLSPLSTLGPRIPWRAGRISGGLRLALTESWVGMQEVFELEALDLVVRDGEGAFPGLDGDTALSGALRRETGPPRTPNAFAPHDALLVRGLVVDRGDTRLRLAGAVNLITGRLDLEPYFRVGDLRDVARAFQLGDLRGRLVLKAARLVGTLDAPRLTASLNWTDAVLDGEPLSRVTGQLELRDGWLYLHRWSSDNLLGSFALDGRLRLLDGGRLAADHPFHIEEARVRRLALRRFSDRFGEAARVDADLEAVEGDLLRPASTLRGRAQVRVERPVLGAEPFAFVRAGLQFGPERIQISDLQAELARGTTLRGHLQVGRRDGAIRGALTVPPLPIASLAAVSRSLPGLSGLVEAGFTLGGTLTSPTLIGTVGILDLAFDDVLLGSAALNLQTTGPDQLDISTLDAAFFNGLTLGRATLSHDGFLPTRLLAEISTDRLQVADLFETLRSDTYRATLTSTLSLDVDLMRGRTAFALNAPPGGVRIAAPSRNLAWENRSALVAEGDGRRVSVLPVAIGLRDRATAPLQLCGALDPARGIDARVAGLLDLGLLPWLGEVFSQAEGGLAIADDPRVTEAGCFPDGTPSLALTGSPARPRIVGTLASRGVSLMPRGSGRGMRVADGAHFVLTPGARPDDLRLEIPPTAPLLVDMDDGAARLSGTVGLVDFLPDTADLHLVGTDLWIHAPGELDATASTVLDLRASELASQPEVAISGDIDISEGRFFKSFDVLSQALGGAFSSRGDVYSRSILEIFPWLGDARLDVNVKAEDFQIQTDLPLARTDLPARLDLGIGGTIARPTVFRRVDLLPNGRLTYFVFERAFRVQTGAIDFDGPVEAPIIDVTAQTTIAYLARASTDTLDEDEREVTVTLRVFGRVPDLKIELGADDATLDQADIQSLLLTGKPRGDLDRAQESRVVSADLAAVINGVLSAPFVKTASVGVGQKGAMEYRVGTCFATNLCFDTTTVADDTETSLRARFSLALGDNLVCEGTLRRSDAATTTNQQTYQARCRYRIPLH